MPYAIDLFCGAGGFSEGILQAGFDIIFSSDKSPMVEETYTNRHKQLGIIEGIDTHFELNDIKNVTSDLIFEKINSLKYGNIFKKGTVDAIFGGPPCQGFSRLGKRDSKDPRNMLFHEYLRLIKDIQPKYVVMENVKGILDMYMLDFPSVVDQSYEGQYLVPNILKNELTHLGYEVLDIQVLNAADFGVPQQRNRAILLACRNDVPIINYPKPLENTTTVYDALGDLYTEKDYKTEYSISSKSGRTSSLKTKKPLKAKKITNMETSKHTKSVIERFSLYKEGENKNKAVQRLKKEGIDLKASCPNLFNEVLFQLNSTNNAETLHKELCVLLGNKVNSFSDMWWTNTNKLLPIISTETDESKFKALILNFAKRLEIDYDSALNVWNSISTQINKKISSEELEHKLKTGDISEELAIALFTKKNVRMRLNAQGIAPTMVTLPDDYIHPYFDRILTVREMARLQSFDDSFEFLGKRTTGGNKRSLETPQFTQVGNAVPPLLSKAIALEVMKGIKRSSGN